MIFLLPALIPVLVTDGPPVIVIPALLITVSPIVKEPSLVKSTSLFKEYVNCLPAWSNTMFLPALKVTVLPGLTFSEVVPFVVPPLLAEVTFQPERLIACATLSVVATPFVVGGTTLPLLSVIVAPSLSFNLMPVASASVERRPSPLTVNVPLSNNTSPLPVSPAYFKLTLLN